MSGPIPAATVLRQLPGRRVVVGASELAHLYRDDERARCGWRSAGAAVHEDLVTVPAMRTCARCLGSLPRALAAGLRPERAELAALHDREARLVAQRCIDDLEAIRSRMRMDGTGTTQVQLVHATQPVLQQPRTRTRADRYATDTRVRAQAQTVTLAGLLNTLTPGGYRPDSRLFLLDPPLPGAAVDPQARR